MRFNKLDLNQLVVLDALFTEQSVKKAAEKLFLSPAATSCALARLRDFFDDDLLLVVGKRMFLTEKAKCLQTPVREALLQIQVITNISYEFDPKSIKRKLVIEASDYIFSVFLMDFLQIIHNKAPLMRFDLRLIGTNYIEDLSSGELDILIAPGMFTISEHPQHFLFEDTWSCIVWDKSSQANEPLTMKKYLQMGHIVPEWGAGRLMSLDEITAVKLGLEREREVTVPNYTMIPSFLEGTNRISSIQTRLARKLSKTQPLTILDCPMSIPTFSEHLQYNKFKEQDPVIVWFKEQLISYCKTM